MRNSHRFSFILIAFLAALTTTAADDISVSNQNNGVYYGYYGVGYMQLMYTNGWTSSPFLRGESLGTNGFPFGWWFSGNSPITGEWNISDRLFLNTNGTLRYEATFQSDVTTCVKRSTGTFSMISTSQVLLTIGGDLARGPSAFGQPQTFRIRVSPRRDRVQAAGAAGDSRLEDKAKTGRDAEGVGHSSPGQRPGLKQR